MSIKVPCQLCDKRYLGCHSSCEQYSQFKDESEEMNRKTRKTDIDDYTAEQILRHPKSKTLKYFRLNRNYIRR